MDNSRKARIAALRNEILLKNSKVPNEQRKEGTFCDLILCSKEKIRIKVHKSVMSTASDFFKDLLTSGLKESSTGVVELEHITGDILEKIVSFVYLGELKPNSPEEVEEIVKHAHYFRLTELIEVCFLFLEGCINDLNCMKYWRLARDYSSERFADACITFILTFDGGQLFSSLLINFTVEEMQILLSNERLLGTEEEIFQATLKWAKFRTASNNTTDVLATFSKVVEFIRFPLMNKEFLSSTVLSNPDLAKDQVLVKKMSEYAEYPNKNNGAGRFLLPKCITPRVGLHSLELVALYGSGVLKISDKGVSEIMETKFEGYYDYGYTTFGSNFLLICGGFCTYRRPVPKVEQYFSPISKKFYDFPKISPKYRRQHSCCVIDNKIYACGGDQGTLVQVFDLDRGQWFDGPRMNKARTKFGLTVVNNSLFAVGGHGNRNFTVEMMDPRSNVRWTNIFHKLNNLNYEYVKCASIENNIYCFTSNQQFIFDIRMNKLRRWVCDVDIFEREKCNFNVCEINGEIGIFAAVDNRFNFFKCGTDGEVTLRAHLDGMNSGYPVIVSMYC